MMDLFFYLIIIILGALAVYFLYFQARVYQEQKELINRESKALKVLRNKNMEAIRSRFKNPMMKLEI